jgi:hypothetical protein
MINDEFEAMAPPLATDQHTGRRCNDTRFNFWSHAGAAGWQWRRPAQRASVCFSFD